jgi:uncharacterized protein YutE (UPF0331/DUF86 family)
MVNGKVVKRQLLALREALGDLSRYRMSVACEGLIERRDAQLLVEYAVLRALDASLDIGKEWAETSPDRERPWYGAGLDEMQQAGAVDGEVAGHLRRWSNLRRHLAGQWRPAPADVFEVFSTDVLTRFADGVDAYLRAAIERLREGAVVAGVVTRVVDYGAFVDLGGVSGVVHIKEMSQGMVRHPSDVLVKGEAVSVVVLSVDAARQRVQLRLEPLRPQAPLVPAPECALAA